MARQIRGWLTSCTHNEPESISIDTADATGEILAALRHPLAPSADGALSVHDRLTLFAFVACLACVVALALVPFAFSAHTAFADEADDLHEQAGQLQQEAEQLQATANDLQAQVEATAAEYNDAVARADELQAQVDDLQAQVDETQGRIDELDAQIPEQQERSAESVRTLYVMREEGFGLLEVILASETLDDFLTRYEYVECMNAHNNAELQRLQDMVDELGVQREQLEGQEAELQEQQAEAQAEADRVGAALAEAQAAREEASAAAVAKAAEQAEAEAAAAMAEQERAAKAAVQETGENDAVDAENDAMEQPETEEPEEVTETVQEEDVSWSSERDAFVAEWAGRIDNYLAGSPMAGQGKTFAAAAWDSGVDPRWSPAISTVESSTGAICFMPYNAWGWGSYSFGSWEEAIPAHVAYLGDMYGSTITPEAASIYCPPNATFWYNRCLEEMNKI